MRTPSAAARANAEALHDGPPPSPRPGPARQVQDDLDETVAHIMALWRECEATKAELAKVRGMVPELLEFLALVQRTSLRPVAQRAARWRTWLAACLPDESDAE